MGVGGGDGGTEAGRGVTSYFIKNLGALLIWVGVSPLTASIPLLMEWVFPMVIQSLVHGYSVRFRLKITRDYATSKNP